MFKSRTIASPYSDSNIYVLVLRTRESKVEICIGWCTHSCAIQTGKVSINNPRQMW